MKKFVCLVLALALVLSLAALVGCSKKEETPAETTPADNAPADTTPAETTPADGEETFGGFTKAELEASAPGEHLVEKCNAGMDVIVQFSGFVDNEVIMERFAGTVEEVVTGYGAQFYKTHAGGDVATMIGQIENYITMGSNMLFLIPPDGASVKDAVMKAQDAGILCCEYGIEDGQYTNATYGVQFEQGYICGEMAYQYAMLQHPDATPGSVEVALLCTHAITPMLHKANGIRQAINTHDIFNVVFYTDGLEDLFESGYNFAETACTASPDLRMIVAQGIIGAIGACNYIDAIPNVKMDEWAVITNSEHALMYDLLDASAAGTSPFRGTNVADMSETAYIEKCVRAIFTGEETTPYQLIYNYSAMTDGAWEFEMQSADVPAEDVSLQYLYD